MHPQPLGLLVMAYGTPRAPEDIEPYYTHIRGGSRPPASLLQELCDRYAAIGGLSPLTRTTTAQAARLQSAVGRRFPSLRFKAYVGLKHCAPFIEDAIDAMAADGVGSAVGIVMAPHYSAFSVQTYNDRARARAALTGLRLSTLREWYRQPQFVACWAERLASMLLSVPAAERQQTLVIFSAHSLPLRTLETSDPYVAQIEESARLIAAAACVEDYVVAWQSAGRTPEPWIGPEIRDEIRRSWQVDGMRTFVCCPIGFVAEHLEVLYDNDIECRAVIEELGGRYLRPAMPNVDASFIEALADAVSPLLQAGAAVIA